MPIVSDIGGKSYTLGRGRLFFDRLTAAMVAAGVVAATKGIGELYMGNTPGVNLGSESEDLEHFSSDDGIRVKDDSVTLQLDRTGQITVDHISMENMAILLSADSVGAVAQSAATAATYETGPVKKDMWYQVGATTVLPTGVRLISNVVVKKGVSFVTTITQAGNYEVDEATGRVWILPNAPDIPNDTALQVTYDAAASTRPQIVSSTNSVYGALHYVANNPKGINRDVYMPYVKLTPSGDFELKGESWQQITFDYEILAKGNLASVYIDGRAVAA